MSKLLFSIQLKINQNVLNLEIMEDDTMKNIIDRLCRRGDQKTRSTLFSKIIDSLLKIKSLDTTNLSLKIKINKFLTKTSSEQLSNKKIIFGKTNQQKQKLKSPLKDIQNVNNVKSISKQRINKLQKRSETKQQSYLHSLSFVNMSSNSNQTDQEKLIAAYKIVLAKSKDEEIKGLIHKTLKSTENNSFKKHKISTSILNSVNQHQSNQKPHLKQMNNKYVYNPVRRITHLMHNQYNNISSSKKATKFCQKRRHEYLNNQYKKQLNQKQEDTIKIEQSKKIVPRSRSTQNCIKKYNYLLQNI